MENSTRAGVLLFALTLFRRSLIALAAVFVVGWFTSCSDDPASPLPDELPDEGAIVSDPVSSASLAAGANADLALLASTAQGNDVVYVSLPPRTVPGGSIAVIRRVGDPGSVFTTVLDGGFDPVAVAAKEGESIDVGVTNANGVTLSTYRVPVRGRRSPIIVRTQPPRGIPDVPLNTAIVVVFSEPIDGSTVTSASIQLRRGTTAIGATVRFLDPTLDASHVSVELVPNVPLAANTAYELVVTTQVRDLDGEGLAAPYTATFTTGQSSTGPPASIMLSPDSVLSLGVRATHQLTATVWDAAGNMLTDHPVTWSTSNPNAVSVSFTGRLTALRDGFSVVTAAVGGVTRALTVVVSGGAPASVAISPTQGTVAALDTIMLAATVRDAAGRTINDPSVTWTSSAPAVGTVAPSNVNLFGIVYGTVTGWTQGSVTITARSGTSSGTVVVAVGPPVPVQSVTVTPGSAGLVAQGKSQLNATLRDATGRILSNRTITWTSNNAAVATVDTNGLVTGVGAGSASVTATSEGVSDAAAITVTTVVFTAMTASDGHTCGLTSSSVAYCWGYNDRGQIGIGSQDPRVQVSPTAVTGGLEFAMVTAGYGHTCGLTRNGLAYCWGSNARGQLGIGNRDGPERCYDSFDGVCSTAPRAVAGGLVFSTLSAGGAETCGLTASDQTYCWGGSAGLTPAPLAGGLTFTAVDVGWDHSCALTSNGVAYCWGGNERGQLGNGSVSGAQAPVAVSGGLVFAALSAGVGHTCGVTPTGAAYCWGFGDALGNGTTTDSKVPVAVSGGLAFATLDAGNGYTCGLTTEGAAFCWGFNYGGQLGIGSATGPEHCDAGDFTYPCSRTPLAVTSGLTFAALNVGSSHSCGLTRNAVAYCWGYNDSGQLGTGSHTNSSVPAKVAGQP